VRTEGTEQAERVVAEAWEAGASGVEEREQGGDTVLILYAPAARADDVRDAAARIVGAGQRLGPIERVESVDWVSRWKQSARATVVSRRLRVRPPFLEVALAEGQREIVIEPGQAFGTGSHASTRLALEWVDALSGELTPHTRVLDVGTGSGVLALAALRLGAGRAVGVEVDRVAAREAGATARDNGLAMHFGVVAGGLEALRGPPFDLVLANLLRSELLPLAGAIAARTRRGGRLVLSGLLEAERAEVERALGRVGFDPIDVRVRADDPAEIQTDDPGERWIALLMGRR